MWEVIDGVAILLVSYRGITGWLTIIISYVYVLGGGGLNTPFRENT